MKIPLADITIPPRHRKQIHEEKVHQLAESIRTIGLIHPIVVDESNTLIAGHHRLLAHKHLSRTDIEATRKQDLSQWDKEVMELEENIRRVDLTYAEELEAKLKLHELHVVQHGKSETLGGPGSRNKWKVADTAQLLGISTGAASQDIKLAKAIRQQPGLGEHKTKISAQHAYERDNELKARQVLAILNTPEGKKSDPHKTPGYIDPSTRLIHGDCLAIIPTLPDESIDCLITDPPWEVAHDAVLVRKDPEKWGDPTGPLHTVRKMLALLMPKLKPDALCWMFCASTHLMQGSMFSLVTSLNYRMFNQFLIWYKPKQAFSSHPYRGLMNDYEPCIMFSKGAGRSVNRPTYAVHSEPILKSRKLHPTQKPPGLLEKLITVSTVRGETVFDPFAGSGSTLKVAKSLDRKSIGCEIDDKWYATALLEVRDGAEKV